MPRIEHVRRFYDWMERLRDDCGDYRYLGHCSGRQGWPRRGVYFFFEEGENRSTSGNGPRVVRVGTHAVSAGARSTLWGRLRQHRGSSGGQGGNHRGSIFRLLIGEAMIQRWAGTPNDFPEDTTGSWGCGNHATAGIRAQEVPIEVAVSGHIQAMPFLWLSIEDAPGPCSDRAILERNCIALLSNTAKLEDIDPPSANWLGRHSRRQAIRDSGLWNQNHVGEPYDISAIDAIFHAYLRR